jgi:hypothetical protein
VSDETDISILGKADVGLCVPNYRRQWSEHHVVSSSFVFRHLEVRSIGKTGRVCEQSGCYKATGSDAERGTAAASDVSTTCNTVISKRHGFVTTAVRYLPYTRFPFCSLTNFLAPLTIIADTSCCMHCCLLGCDAVCVCCS